MVQGGLRDHFFRNFWFGRCLRRMTGNFFNKRFRCLARREIVKYLAPAVGPPFPLFRGQPGVGAFKESLYQFRVAGVGSHFLGQRPGKLVHATDDGVVDKPLALFQVKDFEEGLKPGRTDFRGYSHGSESISPRASHVPAQIVKVKSYWRTNATPTALGPA